MPTKQHTTERGTYVRCGRCKGTGQARYNHLNGDTYCYLCMGGGLVYRPTAAEKAQAEADIKWSTDAHCKLVGGLECYENKLRRPVRQATETTPYQPQAARDAMSPAELAAYDVGQAADRAAARQLTRRLTFWVGEGLDAAMAEKASEQRAHEAAALAAARAARGMQVAA